MSDTEELNVGDFDPSTYQHVLPEGAHDLDDYDSDYAEQHPELGFTDEQVEAEVAKLDPDDKKLYEEYRKFLDIPHTCDLFEDISRVSGLSPAHLGKRGGDLKFSRQN